MNDLALYERCARDWWRTDSHFAASLHALNRVRLAEVRDRLGPSFRGLVVDLGCGGGLIAEPLALAGATVVGCDISGASLAEARRHGREQRVRGLSYVQADARRTPLPDACADLVVCADVIEHIADWPRVITEAARLARPSALLSVSTLSRTLRARILSIWLGEGLGFVPRGTHDHRLFVHLDALAASAAAAGWTMDRAQGQGVDVLKTLRTWSLAFVPTTGTWGSYSAWLRRT
jgi:2-polyprenyl-6-hydroxyphenyl methylase/3-demethylubiquinone-9 3-methyltransferase